MLTQLTSPISILNVASFGVELESFLVQTQAYFSDFAWDHYACRQTQISMLHQTQAVKNKVLPITDEYWHSYYYGQENRDTTEHLLQALSAKEKAIFETIKPTRKRAVSEFSLVTNGSWQVQRVPCKSFSQAQALINNQSSQDFRLCSRVFEELPEAMVDDNLIKLIKGVSAQIGSNDPKVRKMNLVVHHTEVICYPDQQASNAPEGIHQDGMDYIVSALVVERNNVSGGRSIIYGSDKHTRILEVELGSGQGLLQPDKNSQLWHDVTSIVSLDGQNPGSRSTLGFDFSVTEHSQ